MANPESYRPRTSDIPKDPGVYRFIDPDDRVIYVGKAKNLRQRLQNYFQDPDLLHPRTRQMVFTAVRVEWVVVGSEIEALTLEYSWIKEFTPRFNVMYRDDKSYPYLAITMTEEYPRVMVTRNAHKRGDRYYGPYTKVWAVRDSLDQLLRVFPIRSCSAGTFRGAQRAGRPCLLGYIGKCSAPCVGRVSAEEHRDIAQQMVRFLDGTGEDLIREKKQDMLKAAAELDFERAGRLRDDIRALEVVAERNTVVLDSSVDADVFGLVFDELEASVQVFFVRGGRIRGQRGWISAIEDADGAGLVSQLLIQVYGEYSQARTGRKAKARATSVDDVAHTAAIELPREIWVPTLPDDDALVTWLSDLRGANVALKIPQRGAKAQLMETVNTNAAQALQRHKLARAGDITERSQALEELRDGLGLERAPLRIEGYDISHTQGTNQVGSMVVFEDGLAKKSDYRHYIIRGDDGAGARDDTAAMDEVLRRRLKRLAEDQEGSLSEGKSADTASKPRFAYRPDLIVVDGGLPQVNAAQRVVEELGANVAVIGLAKRLEEIWIPGMDFPVILSRTSPALRLLQHLRDESHRFAITFHRKKRAAAMTRSALDDIAGLGPAKQAALLKHFKSVARIKAASIVDLQAVAGIGPALATTIYTHFAGNSDEKLAR
ncbi:excinuclease ABC subunit UvrC [Trueperella pyogenes]|uniref:excinuclease ABC subunit UvrC n=1 Tax=Trueperella pyogenes TaxID=1661 RepID=UPI000E0DC1BB|nr:excinuclease ABC subunit UvrC [Trueperella pyogenes]